MAQFLEGQGAQLSGEILDKLYCYADLVVSTKEFGNLISAKDSEKFLSRHIADSLVPYLVMSHELSVVGKNEYKNPLLKTQNSELKWADMGSGAGCPVFPLAIVMPEIHFYAVEPRNMRVRFMQMAKEKLALKNLTVVGKRFETSGLSNLDFISCRALSTFENDWERAKPGLKKGGMFLTLKSYSNVSHLECDPAITLHKYTLPQEEQVYALVTRGNE